MKHWFAVTTLSLILCFLFGAWWGHRLQDKKKAKPEVKAIVSIAAEKDSIPESFKKKLFDKYQVRLVVQSYESPADLLALAKSTTPPDLVVFPSYMFKGLQHRDLLGPLDAEKIPNTKNISKDLRFGAWDPKEDFAVPLGWDGLFFIYNPKRFSPTSDSLAEVLRNKKLKISLKKDLENVVWLSQVMEWTPPGTANEEKREWLSQLAGLPWSTPADIEKYRKGELDLLQLSWSEIQSLNADLGEFKIWYPTERSPFFLDFIALSKASPNPSKAQKVIHQILDEEIYPEMIVAKEKPAAVMNLESAQSKSAQQFRELPLTRIRPLVNAGFDISDLEQARMHLFEKEDSSQKAIK